jgi:predicted DCC family thiol-disulfide oxidoreductase YuxK
MKGKHVAPDHGVPVSEKEVGNFLEKMKYAVRGQALDLSSDEDLSIGIMNLISIEEHLFFTASKTGKDKYYGILNEIREMRKELLKGIVTAYEGEVWCVSKHLLASSMRLMEVGTKALGKGEMEQAKELFEKSYRLYRLFWEINLQQPGRQDAAPQKVTGIKDVVLFYDTECPHCKKVESFLSKHALQTIFNIVKKEVSANKETHAEMESVYRDCIKGGGEMVVPLAYVNGKCAMGEEAVIRLFKDLMWENVKEIKQTMEALLRKNDVPKHIQSHGEHYGKALDAALNCCKE